MRQSVQPIMKQTGSDVAAQSVNSVMAVIAASLTAAATRLSTAYNKHMAISHLRQMDERMLRDIGIRREDITAAVNGEIDRHR